MHTFPVTDSTLSAQHIGLFLQEKYGLSAATHCRIFRTGINHSYIVTDLDKKFVFRIYSLDWRSELEISEEEKRLLPYAGLSIWIFYLGVQSQRFDNWSNIFLSENYLKRFIGMVKEWLNYNEIEIKVANKTDL